ncbi:MAG: beta-N-acetylglucosaminidase domain-containing protein [Bacteroidales bacterium]|nr:beta-N-acetylglucosaminidase domain-containing protein [Bacteroidales bacterium]
MVNCTRKILILIPLILIALLTTRCLEEDKSVPSFADWSGNDTRSIPYRVRSSQYEKVNLIYNPSFEVGKIYSIDSANTSFQIKGWKKLGDHVMWIDAFSDSTIKPDEVFHGHYAVKIVREVSDETESQGDAIISDFIRVIPGNYELKYHVRLENIQSNQVRRGAKIFDAIDVRLLYYDRNKLLIEGKSINPLTGSFIDNSLKGYNFANYWSIDKLGWAKVNGRTCHFPYSEGDIPDNARFVKIYIGLKGTGTMWIDLVNFRYSRWNFTPLEKVETLFDTMYSRIDLLTPTPQKVVPLRPLLYFNIQHDTILPPLILIPQKPTIQTSSGASILKAKLDKVFCNSLGDSCDIITSVVTNISTKDIVSGRLIFSLGQNNLYNNHKYKVPVKEISNHPQGYCIIPDSINRNLVFLIGTEAIGDYYAAVTASQLLDDSSFVYNQAVVVDYPDYLKRSFLLPGWDNMEQIEKNIRSIEELSFYKLNFAYLDHATDNTSENWFQLQPGYSEGLSAIGQYSRSAGTFEFGQIINPYIHLSGSVSLDSIEENLRNVWYHSNPASMNQLVDMFSTGIQAGISSLLLGTQDNLPFIDNNDQSFVLYHRKDRERYLNLQTAHAYLINQLYQFRNRYNENIEIEFIPPWYNNESIDMSRGRAEFYFSDLLQLIPYETSILWSGGSATSLSLDETDITRFREYIGRNPVLLDNSMNARTRTGRWGGYTEYYPGKAIMCNLFEPFDVNFPDEFHLMNGQRNLFINYPASSELAKIKYATMADYAWNTGAYDPDQALWKILVSKFGPETGKELLIFNEAYFNLYSICMILEQTGVNNRLISQGEETIIAMDLHLNSIDDRLDENPMLVRELREIRDILVARFKLNQDKYPLEEHDTLE